eukprot:444816-Prymnesium_polylepis.1
MPRRPPPARSRVWAGGARRPKRVGGHVRTSVVASWRVWRPRCDAFLSSCLAFARGVDGSGVDFFTNAAQRQDCTTVFLCSWAYSKHPR